ncbi:MAG: DUF268 domain-containing protein [Clostridiales bacterium]|nr:DUF268 domain-containing protein [Clostridiales bacterium]
MGNAKQKIIVWGIGHNYLQNKKQIENQFEIIGYTDNKFENQDILGEKEIRPKDIYLYSYDIILVTSYKYFDSIRLQLYKYGLDMARVKNLDILERECNEELKQVVCDIEEYERLNLNPSFSINLNDLKLMTSDKKMAAGVPAAHYFAQDIWGGAKIYRNNPIKHYDIGSRLDGFIAHLLVFREVNYIDIRPLPFKIPRLHFIQGDATNLEGFENNSIESLSSFHAIEHFGLGRYGDEVDPDAYLKVISNIQRVIKPGGHAYIGVPIGPKDKLVFNAHRIFAIRTILELFDEMKLQDIAVVKSTSAYAEKIVEEQYHLVEDYSCGLFEFIKNSKY